MSSRAQVAAELTGESRRRQADVHADAPHIETPQALTEHVDLAAGRMGVQRCDTKQRRLAGTVAAEYDPSLSGTHRPVDVFEHRPSVVDQRDAPKGEHGIRTHAGALIGISSRCGRPLATAAFTASPMSLASSMRRASTPSERASPT